MLYINLKGMKHKVHAIKHLPLHTPLTPGLYVAYGINSNGALNTMQANILSFYTSLTPGWVQRFKTFFF